MALFSQDRILVPTDFSEKSLQAVRDTVAFAGKASAVHVVYVLKALEATDPGVIWETVNDDQRKMTIQKLFDEKFPSNEYAGLNFSIEKGDPTNEIVDYVEKHQIELIVMPSRGHSGISRFFMGSTAERVIRHAHCPVLVLRE